MKTLIPVNQPGITAWRALTYFNFYRFLIAFLFVALFWIGQLPAPLGVYDSTLFSITVHIYLLFSVIAQLFIRLHTPPHTYQVIIQVLADIVFITLMMYASAGLNSGFGMLLVITVAGGALLSPGIIGILFASIATIAVLGQEIYTHLNQISEASNYIHAGFLGVTYFFTAFISTVLANRVQESEALAQQRGVDLEKLAQLNEYIVQRLQSGIIVVDEKLGIRLLNESSRNMLGLNRNLEDISIDSIPAEIAENIYEWKTGTGEQTVNVVSTIDGIDIVASFVPLNLQQRFELLIFIDDVSQLRQRAQQMKLASLGRLTASIAHEVRNPLGAISHAGQLLSESGTISQDDKRLTAIIEEHSLRVNNIVENIMSISRREQSSPMSFDLIQWLEKFIREFEQQYNLQHGSIIMHKRMEKIMARMDQSQLHQVLWNLLENGLRYSKGMPLIEVECSIKDETDRPYIDVIDHGDGIPPGNTDKLFEPFFTTSPDGTGLGLYIARDLCEANQATLNLFNNTQQGCCFRINLAHPEKQHSII